MATMPPHGTNPHSNGVLMTTPTRQPVDTDNVVDITPMKPLADFISHQAVLTGFEHQLGLDETAIHKSHHAAANDTAAALRQWDEAQALLDHVSAAAEDD